jgi:hypothetical protein
MIIETVSSLGWSLVVGKYNKYRMVPTDWKYVRKAFYLRDQSSTVRRHLEPIQDPKTKLKIKGKYNKDTLFLFRCI